MFIIYLLHYIFYLNLPSLCNEFIISNPNIIPIRLKCRIYLKKRKYLEISKLTKSKQSKLLKIYSMRIVWSLNKKNYSFIYLLLTSIVVLFKIQYCAKICGLCERVARTIVAKIYRGLQSRHLLWISQLCHCSVTTDVIHQLWKFKLHIYQKWFSKKNFNYEEFPEIAGASFIKNLKVFCTV